MPIAVAPTAKAGCLPSDPVPLATIAATGGREDWLTAGDGAPIRFASWRNDSDAPAGTVLYFNGRTEFIERNLETVETLLGRGFDVWTLDWRGQGLSHRALANPHKGHIEDYAQHLDDLRLLFERHLDPARGPGPLLLLAHSMGGQIGLRLLQAARQRFAGAVFSAPLVGLPTPTVAHGLLVGLLGAAGGLPWIDGRYSPGRGDYGLRDQVFRGNGLTHCEERFRRGHRYIAERPDLALGGPTLGWLHATRRSIAKIANIEKTWPIETPILLVSAGADRIVGTAAHRAFCAARPESRRLVTVEGALHELLIERDDHREAFWQAFDAFVGDRIVKA